MPRVLLTGHVIGQCNSVDDVHLVLGWLSLSQTKDGLVSTRITGGRPLGRFGLGAARHPLLCACQSLEGLGGAKSQRQESSVSLRENALGKRFVVAGVDRAVRCHGVHFIYQSALG